MPETIVALLIAAATAGTLTCDALDFVEPVPAVDFAGEVQPLFSENFCTACHGASGGLSLSPERAYEELFCHPTETAGMPPDARRVVPGNPERSWLFLRINCDAPSDAGFRMPVGGLMPTSQQGLLRDWIAQGARPFGGLVLRVGFEAGETCD